MILTFLLCGSYLTMKMAHGLWWGLLVLPPLSGETCAGYVTMWQVGKEGGRGSRRDGVAGEGESGEVSVSVDELDEGEGEGRRGGGYGGGSSAGSNSGGAEGCGLWLVEEEEPFCLGGKVRRRTSWVEQAWHREGLLRRAQNAWA